jgi:hypothetical protein
VVEVDREPRLDAAALGRVEPIGTCPLDEYEDYGPMVARILREAYAADVPLAERADDDDVQRGRNRLWEQAVERLAAALAEVRVNQMGLPPDRARTGAPRPCFSIGTNGR